MSNAADDKRWISKGSRDGEGTHSPLGSSILSPQGDLMTSCPPADAGHQRISAMTLALLEDSGW